MNNLITDLAGIKVGSAVNKRLASGVSLVLFDAPATASIAILGGAPGTRDTALLEPEMTVDLTPDDRRLQAEGFISGVQAVLTDLVAQREHVDKAWHVELGVGGKAVPANHDVPAPPGSAGARARRH